MITFRCPRCAGTQREYLKQNPCPQCSCIEAAVRQVEAWQEERKATTTRPCDARNDKNIFTFCPDCGAGPGHDCKWPSAKPAESGAGATFTPEALARNGFLPSLAKHLDTLGGDKAGAGFDEALTKPAECDPSQVVIWDKLRQLYWGKSSAGHCQNIEDAQVFSRKEGEAIVQWNDDLEVRSTKSETPDTIPRSEHHRLMREVLERLTNIAGDYARAFCRLHSEYARGWHEAADLIKQEIEKCQK